MEWIAPVSTVIGGLLAIGSALAVDRTRSRREQLRELKELRRQVYVRYLTSVIETEAALHQLASTASDALDKDVAMEAWRKYGMIACREELRIVASPEIMRAADRVHDRLVDLRNALMDSKITPGIKGKPNPPEWSAVAAPWSAARKELRSLMQAEVQGS